MLVPFLALTKVIVTMADGMMVSRGLMVYAVVVGGVVIIYVWSCCVDGFRRSIEVTQVVGVLSRWFGLLAELRRQ